MRIVVFISCRDKKEARKICAQLISKRLAACVNILDSVESHFSWKGKVDKAKEVLLFVKTKKICLPKLIKSVKSLHSYEVPEIIALPIVGGEKAYLEWLDDSTRKSA